MTNSLTHIPLVRYLVRQRYQMRKRLRAVLGPYRLRRALDEPDDLKLVIGASGKADPGWIATEGDYLNLLRPADWARYFAPDSIHAMLAEHVWEHLSAADGQRAAQTCLTYLKPGGYLRIAVPDGLHPDPGYRALVDVGRQNGHRVLYTYRTLRDLFAGVGFQVRLYEYFDEAGQFHQNDWDRGAGTIRRSARSDPRNAHGLVYTSIILDAVKP